MGFELFREGHVVEAGDAECGLMDPVALESAVPQNFPVLQPGQGVLDACPSATVDRVLRFLYGTQMLLTTTFSVRNEQTGALVAAVRDGGDIAADPVDSGLAESPAVVATAGQRIADGHHQAAVGVDDHLQVLRLLVLQHLRVPELRRWCNRWPLWLFWSAYGPDLACPVAWCARGRLQAAGRVTLTGVTRMCGYHMADVVETVHGRPVGPGARVSPVQGLVS